MKTKSSFLAVAALAAAVTATHHCQASSGKPIVKNQMRSDVETLSMQRALVSLKQYSQLQNAVGIQNSDLAYAFRKALLIAELLINSDGTLNLSAIPSVQSAFIPSDPMEYETNMVNFLSQFDASWTPFFSQVAAPTDPNTSGYRVLQALFSLAPGQPVTDWHAKVAVLSALLAPENQGPVGDCFAVNDVIRDHNEYYFHSAEDYKTAILNGSINRPVNGSTDCFFFLPTLADTDRDQPIQLSSSGQLQSGIPLLQAPGFAAACSLMGGNGIANLTQSILQNLKNPTNPTPAQVIQAMAQAIAAVQTGSNPASLTSLGNYAFSSLTNHPLLRGVEAAFAAMAEDRINDSTRGNINSCVDTALQNTWKSLQNQSGISEFRQTFQTAFNNSYRLVYNLDIPLSQVSADGSSSDGGFQLYQRIPGHPELLGTRVFTPHDFKELILGALLATEQQAGSTQNIQAIGTQVIEYAKTDAFIKQAIWAYDPSNQTQQHPLLNFLTLSRTPMQSCDGDNPYEVDDIDTGTTYDNSIQIHTFQNTKDLITWCLNLAKTTQAEFCPMNSPQHAFNFVPTNPDIEAFLQSGYTPGVWLQNRLVIPGIRVSRSAIDPSTIGSLSNAIYQQISQALPNPTAYQQLISTLSQASLSVHDFANQFCDGVNHLLNSNATQAHQVGLVIDALLFGSLTANQQAILDQSAVRFAFTNWNEGTDDIYFCAYFNPRTEQIGFGTIFENKTNLQPMDEDAWVNNQQWDVDTTPAAPVSTDM